MLKNCIRISFVALLSLVIVSWWPNSISHVPTSYILLKQTLDQKIRLSPWIVSVVYIDLVTNQHLKINANQLYNPASLIKLPIIVETFSQQGRGYFSWTDEIVLKQSDVQKGSGKLSHFPPGTSRTIYELSDLMMVHSDNTATKLLIDILGAKAITAQMKKMGLKKTELKSSNLLNAKGLNYTTPWDMSYLLKMIFERKVVSRTASLSILNIMMKQNYRWGIPKHLPKTLRIANKTGSLSHEAHDVGIVYYKDSPYMVAIFLSGAGAFTKGKELVSEISKIIYDWKVFVDTLVST